MAASVGKTPSKNTVLFRKWRERMEWTRAETAVKLGVSVHTVKSYELDRRPVPSPIKFLMGELEKDMIESGESVCRSPIKIVGGGAISMISPKLAMCSPAYGSTAKSILSMTRAMAYNAELVLTKMADSSSLYETVADLEKLAASWVSDRSCKLVFWSASVPSAWMDSSHPMAMTADAEKTIIEQFKQRPEIILALFSPSNGASPEQQVEAAKEVLKSTSASLVLANDSATKLNIVIDSSGKNIHESYDRETALAALVSSAITMADIPMVNNSKPGRRPSKNTADKNSVTNKTSQAKQVVASY